MGLISKIIANLSLDERLPLEVAVAKKQTELLSQGNFVDIIALGNESSFGVLIPENELKNGIAQAQLALLEKHRADEAIKLGKDTGFGILVAEDYLINFIEKMFIEGFTPVHLQEGTYSNNYLEEIQRNVANSLLGKENEAKRIVAKSLAKKYWDENRFSKYDQCPYSYIVKIKKRDLVKKINEMRKKSLDCYYNFTDTKVREEYSLPEYLKSTQDDEYMFISTRYGDNCRWYWGPAKEDDINEKSIIIEC